MSKETNIYFYILLVDCYDIEEIVVVVEYWNSCLGRMKLLLIISEFVDWYKQNNDYKVAVNLSK